MSDFKPKRPQRGLRVVPAPVDPTPIEATPIDTPPPNTPPAGPAPIDLSPIPPVEAEPVVVPETIEPYVEAAEPPPPATIPAPVRAAPASPDGWAALTEMQETLSRGLGEIAAEITEMTRSGTEATTNAAVAMLGARTFADAFDIQAGLTRRNLAAAIEGSAKLSAAYVKTATEAGRLFTPRFGSLWSARSTRY